MLPALNHRPDLGSHQIDRLKDQLDFAERDIEEERRERLRMREQLSIQNDVISKLYTRINQIEEEQSQSSKLVNRVLETSIAQQQMETKKLAKLDKKSYADVDALKQKFDLFTESLKQETEEVKRLSNETHSSLLNTQEYLKTLHQTEQSSGGRITTLESNTDAAMECIKSLQSLSGKLQTKLLSVEQVTSEREAEVTASLQDMAKCLSEAKTERNELQQLMSSSSHNLNALKQTLEDRITGTRQELMEAREEKDKAITQTLSELTNYYRNIDEKITEEVSGSLGEAKHLLSSLQANIVKEKSVRLEWEQKLRRDTANVLNNLRQNMREQLSQYITAYEENKGKVDSSIKQLNTSISLIEQSNEATKHGIEHILQAEIKARTSGLKDLEEHVNTVRTAVGAVDNRREDAVNKVKEEMAGELEKARAETSGELGRIAEELSELQDNSLKQLSEGLEETKELIKSVEKTLQSDIQNRLTGMQDEVRDTVDKLVEERALLTDELVSRLQTDFTALLEDTDRLHHNRKEDLAKIAAEIAVKQDQLGHEADVAALHSTIGATNNSVYEAEERVTVIETKLEDATNAMTSRLLALEQQMLAVAETVEPLNDNGVHTMSHELTALRRDLLSLTEEFQLLKEDVTRALHAAPSPTVPAITPRSSVPHTPVDALSPPPPVGPSPGGRKSRSQSRASNQREPAMLPTINPATDTELFPEHL